MHFFQKLLFLSIFFCFLINHLAFSQINPLDVQIARDEWGVPHIFGKTDADAAYGLAWAHCEDNFEDIELQVIQSKGRLAEVQGTKGALFDFAMQFFQIDTLVDALYEKDLSLAFRAVLDGYAAGVNAYVQHHPKEVKLKRVFPVTGKDLVKGYVINNVLMSGAGLALKAINDNLVDEMFKPNEVGSNAFAIAPHRTEDGKTWLVINSHQPIEGRFAWYEVHVQSEEGWNMTGGIFPGGVTPFVGSNENLGWAHTVNYHNFGDVYEITINPQNKNQYLLDGEWVDFTTRVVKLKVKIAGIKLPVKRTIPYTVFGPVFKNKAKQSYAFRFPSAMSIKAAETWFMMNKARNLEEFETALKTMGLTMFNTIYGDKEGNIMLYSGGLVPKRNPDLDWNLPIKSSSTSHLWDEILPYEALPKYINPECGYLFNANNTPMIATCPNEAWNDTFPGLQLFVYNRGERLENLFQELDDTITWQEVIDIKYEKKYDENGSYANNFKALFTLDETKYPKIADAIEVVKKWNFESNVENEQAPLVLLTHKILAKKYNLPFAFLMIKEVALTEMEMVDALTEARKYMKKKYKTLELPLGEMQKLVRGNKMIPVGGSSEVLRASDTELHNKRKGIYKMTSGDGYILFAKYAEGEQPELYSINNYGASNRKDSPHFDDQMEMFINQETKQTFLQKDIILERAVSVYSPK